jgi:hypothetical protein
LVKHCEDDVLFDVTDLLGLENGLNSKLAVALDIELTVFVQILYMCHVVLLTKGQASYSSPGSIRFLPVHDLAVVEQDAVGPLVHVAHEGTHVAPHQVVGLGPVQSGGQD